VALLRLSYVRTYRDRHGRLRRYFRRRGQPDTPLPGEIGSEEFMYAYQTALGRRLSGMVRTPQAHYPSWSRSIISQSNLRTSNPLRAHVTA
jgi:hypothetical protein